MASYRSEHGPVKDACLHSNLQSQDCTKKGRGGGGGGLPGWLQLQLQIRTDFADMMMMMINDFVMYAFVEISHRNRLMASTTEFLKIKFRNLTLRRLMSYIYIYIHTHTHTHIYIYIYIYMEHPFLMLLDHTRRSPAEIVGSNPTGGMDICLL